MNTRQRDKRTVVFRASFTEGEAKVIEAALKTMEVRDCDRHVFFRQSLRAVALAVIRGGSMPVRLMTDLRHMTDEEREFERSLEAGGFVLTKEAP